MNVKHDGDGYTDFDISSNYGMLGVLRLDHGNGDVLMVPSSDGVGTMWISPSEHPEAWQALIAHLIYFQHKDTQDCVVGTPAEIRGAMELMK
jgi:hypothetical protein